MSRLTVSIVNWNTRDHLATCLESLRVACRAVEAEVVVVDNASGDGSADLVRRRFPEVRLLALDRNLGFGAANNLAIEYGAGDYVLVLNPDVVVLPETIPTLLAFMADHPEAAAVGPSLTDAAGRTQGGYYSRFPSRAQVLFFFTILYYVAGRIPALRRRYLEHDLRGHSPIVVDQIPGAFLLVRRSVLDEVGLFDPDYFVWFEDVDWCYRLRATSHRLYAVPAARAFHAGGASFQEWSIDRGKWQFLRAFFRFACKHRLDDLVNWSYRVILTDLYVKQAVVRGLSLLRRSGRTRSYSPRLLPVLRDGIRDVVRRYRRGELARFTEATATPGVFRAPTDGGASVAPSRT